MKKCIFGIAALVTIFFILPVSAFAAVREISVYLYQDYADCVFFVSWQNSEQAAAISIKAPDDTMIEATAQNTEFFKGGAAVSVGYAGSGTWTIYVQGDSLGTISISGGSKYREGTQDNAIQSFTADVSNGYINFTWSVISELDAINLTINASQGENIGNRTVYNDYSAPKIGTTSISADDLQTGIYVFSIYVYDGNAQYTLNTDKPLYVKQSNAPDKLEGIKLGSIDGEMFISWDAQLNSAYIVTLYDYDTLAVVKTEWVYDNFLSLPDAADRAKVSVAAADGNVYGDFDIFEIIRSTPSGTVTFPDYAVTRESAIPIYIDCPAGTTAGVYIDGTLLLENADSGSYDLNLSEGIHEIAAYIKDINGNMKTFTKAMTVDRTPPIISISGTDKVSTSANSVVIEGQTEPNATVAVNGVEQELGGGSFMARLALENGVNPITISAYDAAGNKGVKTITAERTGSLNFGWTIFILPALAFVLLTVWYVYLNKKTKGAQEK